MPGRTFTLVLLSLFAVLLAACEIDTKFEVAGANPPVFGISGNGFLTSIRVRGHQRQRDAQGEAQYLQWVIEVKENGGNSVGTMGSVTYGIVPEGYQQIYPESGCRSSHHRRPTLLRAGCDE